jgi:hypothetical protein
MKKTDNKAINSKVFIHMNEMVKSTSVAIDMIDDTPNVNSSEFTLTAVRELLDAINGTSFDLMMMCAAELAEIDLSQKNR